MSLSNYNFKKIKGDASFRIFFRKRNNNQTSIIVYSKKEKKKNLLIYDAINKILLNNCILAPKLLNQNYDNNFIEVNDFGDVSIFKELKTTKKNKLSIFKKIIFLLIKIQKIKTKEIKTFLKTKYKIPIYSNKIILNEANLFTDWYVPKIIKKQKVNTLKVQLNKIYIKLLSNMKLKNNIFVHRDFHVSNLMKVKKNIGVIDAQDALYGNIAYDLASLVDDVRIKTSNKLKEKIFLEFIKSKKKIDVNKLKNDFEILSVLRNLKIIGIFTRLSIRDKKHNYLKLIPHVWKLIEYRISKNYKFEELKFILDKYFPEKIRESK
jgi:hypothetical protein